MNKFVKVAVFSLLSWSGVTANADEAAVRSALLKSMPTLKVDSVKPSEVKGLYEAVIGANIFYVSDDGKYLLQGRLVDIAAHKDLTEEKLNAGRKLALAKLTDDKMIIFKAKDPKYKVFVFTDIDCGYCRKLHSEMDSYLAQGITIQYLFFPRAGKPSESYDKAVSVWCADDQKAALTAAKKGENPKPKTCANPVDEHMKLAEDFDVKGTPMIVTPNGSVYPGYLPAAQLKEALQSEQAAK
jgi:thiol:disulfide interchange protein DsbC